MKPPEYDYFVHLLSSLIDHKKPQRPPDHLDWEKLYRLSVWHNVSNMIWYALMELDPEYRPSQCILKKFKNDYMIGIAKEAVQHITMEKILEVFEEAHIFCLPLKGYLLKYLYPRLDMRQMADIDILIKDEQAEQIKELLCDMGFLVKHRGGNHDSYHREPYMNLEMHRKLVSDNSPYSDYLNMTWERVTLKEDCGYTYKLSNEDFYIYLIIHLTKHYLGRGTGIRSFIDIFLYDRYYRKTLDFDYIRRELEKIKLWEFTEKIIGLCSEWFDGGKNTGLYDEIAEYILCSGVYGRKQNAIIAAMGENTGRKYYRWAARQRYRLKLFFPTVSAMQIQYPFLKKSPQLLPISWILRGMKCLIFKRGHTFQLIKSIYSVTAKDVDRMRKLREKTGFKY